MKGARLKKLREEKEYSQEKLAELLEVSPSAIGMYETDKREPSDEIKIRICELLNCSLDYLLGKSNIRNSENSFKNEFVEDFTFAYHKETNGLTKEEIKEAIEFYKKIKYGNNKEKK